MDFKVGFFCCRWVCLCGWWLARGGLCWSPEKLRCLGSFLHVVAWGLPAAQTVAALVRRNVDPDELTGKIWKKKKNWKCVLTVKSRYENRIAQFKFERNIKASTKSDVLSKFFCFFEKVDFFRNAWIYQNCTFFEFRLELPVVSKSKEKLICCESDKFSRLTRLFLKIDFSRKLLNLPKF